MSEAYLITGIIGCITGIIGSITGISGLALSIFNYFRDKPDIQITLQWDMESFNLPQLDPSKKWGVVSVTNIGRRPVFISHVSLKTNIDSRYLVLTEGLVGEKLLEGDPPKRYPVKQDGLEEFAEHWQAVRAIVYDSTGKEYLSKPVKERPSWAHK